MKKSASLILFILCISPVFSQTVKDIFSKDYPIAFYGIDFTRVKLVGKEFSNPQQIRDMYFSQWNQILIDEGKYDLRKPLRKNNVFPDFSQVMKRNLDVKAENLINYDPKFLSVTEVAEVLNQYDFGSKNGIGLLFLADVFDYTKQKSVIHIIFFDLSTKKILLYDLLRGEPGGVGIRNFWANSVASVIGQIDADRYNYWKKVYID